MHLWPWDSVDKQRTRILKQKRETQNESPYSTRTGQKCLLNLPQLAGHPKLMWLGMIRHNRGVSVSTVIRGGCTSEGGRWPGWLFCYRCHPAHWVLAASAAVFNVWPLSFPLIWNLEYAVADTFCILTGKFWQGAQVLTMSESSVVILWPEATDVYTRVKLNQKYMWYFKIPCFPWSCLPYLTVSKYNFWLFFFPFFTHILIY